ncbi:MAG TPA: aldo/keto reductase [Acetobacteraceae bacterium]|nr:aldo/keto reductase [Acetobacteraceae bacterium]
MERRDFMKASAGVAAAAASVAQAEAAGAAPGFDPPQTIDEAGMKYRILGRTGERVSLVGIGGFHLAKPGGPDEAEAIRIVRTALDAGVNFLDNCWDYNGGESELRMGKALRDGYRQRAFVMTKIDGRTAPSAMGQIETSLKRLQIDTIDLMQFHEVIRMDDPERIFALGGALEAVLRAKEQGKVRYIGFTGHKSPAIHAHMLEVARSHGFRFDTVQMPVNIMDAHFDSFQKTIFPLAQRVGTAVLAMKTFGDDFILKSGVAQPIEMLHYSMSQPVAVVITGCDHMRILDQAIQAARTYQPMTRPQQEALLARSASTASHGQTEHYKASQHFDGTVQHPHWLTEG